MELKSNRWYVQWFFLSLHIMRRFTGKDEEWRYKRQGTNLCQFMRVTLIWAPLIVLLNVVMYGLVLGAIVIVPLREFGVWGTLSIFGVILAIILAIAVFIFLIWGAHVLKDTIEDRVPDITAAMRERKERKAAERARKGPSFGSLVWQWVVATKQRFCPTITFNEA